LRNQLKPPRAARYLNSLYFEKFAECLLPMPFHSGTSKLLIMKKASKERSAIVREISGILLIFLGTFVLISLISYHHSDPSIFTRSNRISMNYAGRIGANFAEALVQFSGLASFLFCALLFSSAARAFKGVPRKSLIGSTLWHLISIATCATLLSLVMGSVHFGGDLLQSGGWLGGLLSKLLIRELNFWGATLFTLCALLIALVFSTPFSASTFFGWSWQITRSAATWIVSTFLSALHLLREEAAQTIWSASQKRRSEKLISNSLANKGSTPLVQTAPPLARNSQYNDDFEDDSELEVVAPSRPAAPKPAPKKASRPITQGKFSLPPLEFLNEPPLRITELDRNRLVENSKILETKLTDFGIEGQVTAVRPGPVITMYEFKPGPGVKISQIAALADDLSLALSAQSVRIVAPIPGKSVVGIEIPNEERETVFLREILSTEEFQGNAGGIPIAIGKDISGAPIVSDISRMPHLLVAGASGKGKSVFINSLICSLLYKFTPNDLRLLMVDPKQVELNLYEDIPHLLLPVVDDMKKASTALKWAVNEMERRYKIMAKSGIRNLAGFNQKLEKEGEAKMRDLLCPQDDKGMPTPTSLAHLFEFDEKGLPRIDRLPTILVIIDEFADLMMVAPKDIETSVARLGQKARAAGIHLVIATQRPSVDVITGLIKANLPSRISFQVASKVDSRTILDGIGSEKLLGQGDMLFIPPGMSQLKRAHGAFINEEEIVKICEHWRSQGKPIYKEEILEEQIEVGAEDVDGAGDELYEQALTIVREMGQASASMLQRRLKVGYNRAARMVEAMEAQGVVGPADGAKPREVLY
jgi:S-DNA-T family DNA segregation ATPase FtsK/SpoIIIE